MPNSVLGRTFFRKSGNPNCGGWSIYLVFWDFLRGPFYSPIACKGTPDNYYVSCLESIPWDSLHFKGLSSHCFNREFQFAQGTSLPKAIYNGNVWNIAERIMSEGPLILLTWAVGLSVASFAVDWVGKIIYALAPSHSTWSLIGIYSDIDDRSREKANKSSFSEQNTASQTSWQG